MKKLLVPISMLLLFFCCKNNEERKNEGDSTKENGELVDSLKWLFYAYSYTDSALFKKGEKILSILPVQCDIYVDTVIKFNSDSVRVAMRFSKEGYTYSHLFPDPDILGFVYYNHVAKPLTGMITYDNFDNWSYLEIHNQKTDSAFRAYLKKTDSRSLSPWLFDQAKKRNVF